MDIEELYERKNEATIRVTMAADVVTSAQNLYDAEKEKLDSIQAQIDKYNELLKLDNGF